MTNHKKRIEVLNDLGVLDSGPERVYDDLTKLTADICEVPICLISLVEENRQWFKSEVGLGICETKIEQSICAHAIAQDDYLEIPDTHLDDRTIVNTLCQGDKPIRYYAGALLRTVDGWPLGTLCVLDYRPRRLNELQKRALKVHANSVTRQLELTRVLLQNAVSVWENPDLAAPSQADTDLIEKTHKLFETLTSRESEIMGLIVGRSGNLSSKQIARELNISHRTVDFHRANILSKMAAGSVAELIALSIRARLF